MHTAFIVLATLLAPCLGASVDVTQSSFACNISQSVTAGSVIDCTVSLRASGVLTGDSAELCRLSTNVTHAGGGDDTVCQDTASAPFSYVTTGTYTVTLSPTAAGWYGGSILYEGSPIGAFSTLVLPGEEDLSKLVSSCSYTADVGTACTTSHRDVYLNKIKTCFQRWSGSEPHFSCDPVMYTTSN